MNVARAIAAGVVGAPALAACGGGGATAPMGGEDGRLLARPVTPTRTPATLGLRSLGIGSIPDAQRFIPTTYTPSRPLPLVVMFHGATGSAAGGIAPFLSLAESAGVVLLAPQSRGFSWDRRLGAFGPDVRFIDRMLAELFEEVAIDPARMAMAGFSDGASYALSLGLTNGDVFRQLVAFSPGFSLPMERRGLPRLFVSHGRSDAVLPFSAVESELVPDLRLRGHDVTFRPFDGPHGIPLAVAAEAMDWLCAGWA